MLRENNRSFEVVINQIEDRKLRLSFVSKDSGQQVMTVQDVAQFLRVDREKVRRLCGGRQMSRLPFVKVSEKMIRFNRPDIEKWAGSQSNGTTPATGRSVMDAQRLRFLARFFEGADFQKWIERNYDRTFTVIVDDENRKIRLQFASNDSGHSIMTVRDVAEFLQTDSATVRRLCQRRAQKRSHHPLPYKKFTEKTLRFNRSDVYQWWTELVTSPNGRANSSRLKLVKGRIKKG